MRAAQMTGNEEGIHVQHGSTLVYDPKVFQGPEAAAVLALLLDPSQKPAFKGETMGNAIKPDTLLSPALRAFLAEMLMALRLGCDVLGHPPTAEDRTR